MKRFKRLLALTVALVMMLAMSITALAATITVENAVKGETYTAYKIFDVTTSVSGEGKTYAYTMAAKIGTVDNPWVSIVRGYTVEKSDAKGNNSEQKLAVFDLNQDTSGTNQYVVTINTYENKEGKIISLFESEADAAGFAQHLATHIPESGLIENTDYFKVTAGSTGEDGKVTVSFENENLSAGYYFVTTSLGTLCVLDTSADDVVIGEKNSVPILEKKILVETVNGSDVNSALVDDTTASIGDTIIYQITITDGKGTDKAITVHDVMEPGLTLKKNNEDDLAKAFTIKAYKADDQEITMDSECSWSVSPGNKDNEGAASCTFEIIFNDKYISALGENDKIVITYSAKLNANAEIASDTNDNTAWLVYSQQISEKDTVTVTTYEVDMVKTGEKNDTSGSYPVLGGAKFKLYDSATGGTEITLKKVTDTTNGDYYCPVFGDEKASEIELGEATIRGLGNGTYYLEETVAPAGYNGLTERKMFTINGANLTNTKANNNIYSRADNDTGLQIINKAGSLLPSTGGMGTTIFYVIGGILVIGAGVLLITKRRMDDTK